MLFSGNEKLPLSRPFFSSSAHTSNNCKNIQPKPLFNIVRNTNRRVQILRKKGKQNTTDDTNENSDQHVNKGTRFIRTRWRNRLVDDHNVTGLCLGRALCLLKTIQECRINTP